MIHFCYVKLSGIALVVIWWKPHTHRIKDIRCRTRESLLRREGFQDVFNKIEVYVDRCIIVGITLRFTGMVSLGLTSLFR